SIAVVPFTNVGDDPANAYLADGLTEEIITGLSRLRTLRVAARGSSYALRGSADPVAVGQRLRVDTVLEGSVQRAADRIRVSARLVDTGDGLERWATRFDRRFDDVFAMQDELSTAIVHTLKATLLGADAPAAPATPTTSAAAFERYLKGRFAWNSRTEDGLGQAIEHFLDAAALDPRYAPAYAGLGDTYAVLGTYGARAPRDVFPRAREHAARARAIDPSLAEAHATIGLVACVHERDWVRAADAFRRAITLQPGYSTAYQWRAVALHAPRGDFAAALEDLAEARTRDPLSLPVRVSEGIVLAFARRVDDAIAAHERTLADLPESPIAAFFLGQALLQAGRPAEAARAIERAIGRVRQTPEMLAVLAQARAALGDTDRARTMGRELERLRETRYVSPALIAQLHLALGEDGLAQSWLDRAADEEDAELLYLDVRPVYDRLRDTDGFAEVRERARLA
ncbi:MAG: tetratricopeptide repeat protein, partial [Gemmatimonadaceae bacterium]|nr:tetratricopeptide repeat protein [Gemmatimonadaceae bacterium]